MFTETLGMSELTECDRSREGIRRKRKGGREGEEDSEKERDEAQGVHDFTLLR